MNRLAVLLLLACTPATAAETLVVYGAPWCGPCRQFKADLADDAALAGGREVRHVDVDQEPDEAKRQRIHAVPTFVLLNDGKERKRTVGYDGTEKFRKWLEQ